VAEVAKWNETMVLIATSIAPVGIEKQQEAIQTWLDLGFSVVSLNIQQEIDKLAPIFSEVRFHRVDRDGKALYGKPFVYIDDILKYLALQDVPVSGIVNSDIHMRAGEDFLSFINQEAQNAMIFASRMDINTVEDHEGEIYGYGFDMFFFDRSVLSRFPSTNLCLGVPWWDYWVPFSALQNGIHTKYLQNTTAYHIKHKINYSLDTWRRVGIWFAESFKPGIKSTLVELYEAENFKDLDDTLGPEVTYDFIQKVYQEAKLIIYGSSLSRRENLCDDNLILLASTFEATTKTVNIEESIDKLKKENSSEKYMSSARLAWQAYVNRNYSDMKKNLNHSLIYSPFSKAKTISNLIDIFHEFSQAESLEFDIHLLSSLSEWNQLIRSQVTEDLYQLF